jgi:hypothetical protein
MAKILIASPHGGMLPEYAISIRDHASRQHQVVTMPMPGSGEQHTPAWVNALNRCPAEGFDYYSQHHADVAIHYEEGDELWADVLVEELREHDADFVSVPCVIKDDRGVCSCGIGDPLDDSNPWRRFTLRELEQMPQTFSYEDIGDHGRFLLHNPALCMWNMKQPAWFQRDGQGRNPFHFTTRQQILWDGEGWILQRESEDWHFSRQMWQRGIRSIITRRVKLIHYGQIGFASWGQRGRYHHDEDLRCKWAQGAES